MKAADTSVVVAAFASWHQGHSAARRALATGAALPAHVALETYSVLTRLPPPHRAGAQLVLAFLEASFPPPWLTLPDAKHMDLLRVASEKGIRGGALYDALVAATAVHADATLLTRDRRAAGTYAAMGASYQMFQ